MPWKEAISPILYSSDKIFVGKKKGFELLGFESEVPADACQLSSQVDDQAWVRNGYVGSGPTERNRQMKKIIYIYIYTVISYLINY